MQLLWGAVYALEMACAKGRLAELASFPWMEENVAVCLTSILLRALALAAAACAGSSEALAYMPVWGPCSGKRPLANVPAMQGTCFECAQFVLRACPAAGPRLAWRPIDTAAWAVLHDEISALGSRLAEAVNAKVEAEGSDFLMMINVGQVSHGMRAGDRTGVMLLLLADRASSNLSPSHFVLQSRDLLFILPTAIQLLTRVEALDAAVATALDVPSALDVPTASSTLPLDASIKASADGLEAVEDGGGGGVQNTPKPTAAKPARSHLSVYINHAKVLFLVYSSLAAWMTLIKCTVASFAALPRALSSRTEMSKGVCDVLPLLLNADAHTSCTLAPTLPHPCVTQPSTALQSSLVLSSGWGCQLRMSLALWCSGK